MFQVVTIFLSLALASQVWAECPALASLDVKYDSDTFACAYIWQEFGDNDPIQACNVAGECSHDSNQMITLPDEYARSVSQSDPDHDIFEIGSLAVLAGCTFYEFKDYNYEGNVYTYPGDYGPAGPDGLLVPNYNGWHGSTDRDCPDGDRSYKCRCTQKMISCQPDDEFVQVLTCDNVSGSNPLTCTHSVTKGTSYSTSATESMSVSTTVSNEIQLGIGNTYVQFGKSSTTGYDWSTTTEETFEVSKTDTITTSVEPGEIYLLEQAVGHCDDNYSYSDYFKATTTNAQGRITSTDYYTREKDGSFKKVAPINN